MGMKKINYGLVFGVFRETFIHMEKQHTCQPNIKSIYIMRVKEMMVEKMKFILASIVKIS